MQNRNINVEPDLDIIAESLTLPFPLKEYQNRLNKVRKEMEARGIQMLYITSPESMYYISGLNMVWYTANSSSMWDGNKSTGIAIHVDHDDFILFQMADEDALVMGSTCAKNVRIKAETSIGSLVGKSYEGPVPGESDIMDLIVKDLKNENWLNCTVALELGCYRPPTRVMLQLQEKFKAEGCTIVDGTDIVAKIRSKKSPMELNYIRKAAAIADVGHKAIAENFHAGMTELQVVGLHTKAMMDAGGESMAIVEMVRSGLGKVWGGHYPASRRVIMPGEPVAVDLSGVYNRYHANTGRFYHVGEPTEEYAREYRAGNALVMQEVKKILKTNMRIRDFFDELIKFYKETGIWDTQAFIGGYEMGIGFPPDWCGQFVYDAFLDDNDARFEPGMTINFETGLGVIDPIIFTEEGVEYPAKTTYELVIVE